MGFHAGKDTVFNGILRIISSPLTIWPFTWARWSQKAEKMKVKVKRLESTKPAGFGGRSYPCIHPGIIHERQSFPPIEGIFFEFVLLNILLNEFLNYCILLKMRSVNTFFFEGKVS